MQLRLLGKDGKSFDEAIKLFRLKDLGHLIIIPSHLVADSLGVEIGWINAKSGQNKICFES